MVTASSKNSRKTGHMELSGHRTEAKHGQGMGVTSGEAGTLGGKTETEASSQLSFVKRVCVGG